MIFLGISSIIKKNEFRNSKIKFFIPEKSLSLHMSSSGD